MENKGDIAVKINVELIENLGSEKIIYSHLNNTEIRIKTAKSITKDRIPIIVGTGEINPYNVIYNTNIAQKCGADIAMIISPYYVKPTQKGIIDYYKIICEKSGKKKQMKYSPNQKEIY